MRARRPPAALQPSSWGAGSWASRQRQLPGAAGLDPARVRRAQGSRRAGCGGHTLPHCGGHLPPSQWRVCPYQGIPRRRWGRGVPPPGILGGGGPGCLLRLSLEWTRFQGDPGFVVQEQVPEAWRGWGGLGLTHSFSPAAELGPECRAGALGPSAHVRRLIGSPGAPSRPSRVCSSPSDLSPLQANEARATSLRSPSKRGLQRSRRRGRRWREQGLGAVPCAMKSGRNILGSRGGTHRPRSSLSCSHPRSHHPPAPALETVSPARGQPAGRRREVPCPCDHSQPFGLRFTV